MDLFSDMSKAELIGTIFSLIVSIFISAAAAAWIYYDSSRLKQSTSSKIMWVVATFLMWILFLPIWLLTRPSVNANGELVENKGSSNVLKGCAFGCLGFVLLLILGIFVAGAYFTYRHSDTMSTLINKSTYSEKAIDSKITNKKNNNKFDIVETKWYRDEHGSRSFIGKIKNNSGYNLQDIIVTVGCYNDNGDKITETFATIPFAKNQETFDFIAPVIDGNVRSAKVTNVQSIN